MTIRHPGWSDLAPAVNRFVHSAAALESSTLRGMDDYRTWRDVKAALDARPGLTISALADHIRMDKSQLSRLLKAGDGELKVRQADLVDEFFKGEPSSADDVISARATQASRLRTSSTRLPVFGYAAAADGERFVLNEGHVLEERELPMGIAVGPGDYFIVLPTGSSMEPRIMAGEAQVVRRGYPPARDKGAVIEFTDGTAVIKNYRGMKDGRVWAEQFNPPKMLDYDATTVKAVHAVVFSF